MRSLTTSRGWIAAALSLTSLSLWAQAGPAPVAAHAGPDPAGAHSRPHQDHLGHLKTRLQLQSDQEAAWSAFAAAMAPPVRGDMAAQRAQQAELMQLSTPERIERLQSLRQQRQAQADAAMEKRNQATKAFYAVLNAAQKKVFDEETARHMARRKDRGPQHLHRG